MPDPAPPAAPSGGRPPLTPIRLIFAIIGGLIMLFTGGCTLLFLAGYVHDELTRSGGEQYVNIPVILTVGGPPFLLGLLVWYLAARAGRGRA
jgi:hypothetical protein